MPGTDDVSKADLTFIVGDPRSGSNLSRIRSHASRATKKPLPDAEDSAITSDSPSPSTSLHVSSPPSPLAHSESTPRSASDGSPGPSDHFERPSSPPTAAPTPRRHPWVPDFRHPQEPAPKQVNPTPLYAQFPHLENVESHRPKNAPGPDPVGSFTTRGSQVGTWWERHPAAQPPAPAFQPFNPHKRSRLSLGDREEVSTETTRFNAGPRAPGAPLSRHSIIRGGQRTPHLLNETRGHGGIAGTHGRTGFTRSSATRRSVLHTMQGRWRLTPGPAESLSLPAEHPETQFETVLSQTENFYRSNFETMWQPIFHKDRSTDGIQAPPELINESLYSVAALFEVGQTSKARRIVQGVTEQQQQVIYNNHPSAYYTFVAMSFDTSNGPLGQLNASLKTRLIPISEDVLGPDHPITKILRLSVPDSIRPQLQVAIMTKIRDSFYHAFGSDALQSMAMHMNLGRILTRVGRYHEAIETFSALLKSIERSQPMNSLVALHVLFEKVGAMLASGDYSMMPELHLNDALRRLQVISQRVDRLPEGDEEKQAMEIAMACCKVMALRLLGRLQAQRQNFGAAIQIYSQAVDLGLASFGPDAVPVKLAEGELDGVKMEELKHSMAGLALPSVDGRDAPPPSDNEFTVTQTALGPVRSINPTFLGKHAHELPSYPGMVFGYSVPEKP